MAGEWKTEDDGAQGVEELLDRISTPLTLDRPSTPPELEYKVKAHIVLVDSDKYNDWGIVEDTLSNILWRPGMGEVVGTWSRAKFDGLIHITLGTSLSALQDRAVQFYAQYADERTQVAAGTRKPSKRSSRAGKDAEPAPEPTQELSVEKKIEFNSLRARLGRAK